MKNNLLNSLFKLLGTSLFLSVIACATRSSPPAPVVDAHASAYPQSAPSKQAVTPPKVDADSSTAKLQPLSSEDKAQTTTSANSSAAPTNPTVVAKQPADGDSSGWQSPTEGAMGKYSADNKGVNISGTKGQPIYAVASGKVLYSGNGLKGYGNLIIIRHENSYLSAYAYNKENLVKEGAMVKQGQKIATMGLNDSNQPMLHFEVRKNGKPIDPHTMIGN